MTEKRTETAETLSALIVTDGKMGDLAPCRGVAAALGAASTEVTVTPSKLALLTRRAAWTNALRAALDDLNHMPDVILASGRRAAPYLALLKKHFDSKPLTVCLKDPRTGAKTADILWVPTHDALRGPNVLVTDTSPHPHSADRVAKAADHLRQHLPADRYPKPWLGVFLGGPTRRMEYTQGDLNGLTAALQQATQRAGAVLITPSRRTPAQLVEQCKYLPGNVWVWDGAGENPYAGMLGACDAFLVTGDSHNMVSEALSAGRQVMVFRPENIAPKFANFLDRMQSQGLIAPPGEPDFDHHQTALDASPIIAKAILDRLNRP